MSDCRTRAASAASSGCSTSSMPAVAARSRMASVGRSSTTTSVAGSRWRATASPVTPKPTTSARTGFSVNDVEGQEVRIEKTEGQRRAQGGEDPEPDDHRRLGPAGQLEVVVDRRHPEHPAVEQPEAGDLDHDTQRLEDEQPADD